MPDHPSPVADPDLVREIAAAIAPELVPLEEAADAVSLRLDRLEGR